MQASGVFLLSAPCLPPDVLAGPRQPPPATIPTPSSPDAAPIWAKFTYCYHVNILQAVYFYEFVFIEILQVFNLTC